MRNKELERVLADVRLEGDPLSPSLEETLTVFYGLHSSRLEQSIEQRVDLAIERLARAAQAHLQPR